jgi:hypothetical protein
MEQQYNFAHKIPLKETWIVMTLGLWPKLRQEKNKWARIKLKQEIYLKHWESEKESFLWLLKWIPTLVVQSFKISKNFGTKM